MLLSLSCLLSLYCHAYCHLLSFTLIFCRYCNYGKPLPAVSIIIGKMIHPEVEQGGLSSFIIPAPEWNNALELFCFYKTSSGKYTGPGHAHGEADGPELPGRVQWHRRGYMVRIVRMVRAMLLRREIHCVGIMIVTKRQ